MSKINKELFNDVSLYNMRWEKEELENIIEEKKQELKQDALENTLEIIMDGIRNNTINEAEMTGILNYFMRRITDIERTL